MKTAPTTPLGSGLTGGVVRVTPDLAKKWLELNDPGNRAISYSKVQQLSTDMRNGHWRLTHQGICFNDSGRLIDGQHRLSAIIDSCTTVELLVIGNPDSTISDPIDRSMQRTLAYLISKSSKVVSALNILRMYEIGYAIGVSQTTAEAQEAYEHHRGPLEAIQTRVRCFSRLPGPILASCAWVFPCEESKIVDFAQKVATGEMIQRGDPAYALRNWLDTTGRGANQWQRGLAALNAIRHHVHDAKLKSVFMGEMGYRASVGRRRALKIAYTPDTSMVLGTHWRPKASEGEGGEE